MLFWPQEKAHEINDLVLILENNFPAFHQLPLQEAKVFEVPIFIFSWDQKPTITYLLTSLADTMSSLSIILCFFSPISSTLSKLLFCKCRDYFPAPLNSFQIGLTSHYFFFLTIICASQLFISHNDDKHPKMQQKGILNHQILFFPLFFRQIFNTVISRHMQKQVEL